MTDRSVAVTAPETLRPSAPFQGLTNDEASARLARDGYNELPLAKRRTAFRIVLEVIREPMLALLLCGGGVYLALGDVKDAMILLIFAGLSVVITVVQETRTERVLEALRDLTSPRALVFRSGVAKRIAGRELAQGDFIVLSEGDRVAADARLVEAKDLETDESLLTGEAVPVRKAVSTDAQQISAKPGGDGLPTVFAGSLIVRGAGVAEVTATGPRSEIGKIGQSLSVLETSAPQLQIQTRKLTVVFAIVGGTVSLLVVLLYGLLRGGWLDAALAGIAVGMSMLPGEFPVILTVFMAMGAWRISQMRVLTRRASAIEALGSATVLCTDKTGTLTENRMTIAELRLSDRIAYPVEGRHLAMPQAVQELVSAGVLASAQNPFDPMEKAFHALAKRDLPQSPALHLDWSLERTYPLRPDCLAMSNVWRDPVGGDARIVAAKGAPEAIAILCGMTPEAQAAITKSVDEMAGAGLRVLGVARAAFTGSSLPDQQQAFRFDFIGLVGLADPLRSSVPAAIAECRTAGIRVLMITGDYPTTARAVARAAGLGSDDLVTGDELKTLTDAELAVRVRTATLFARVMPDQKLRIVEALKADGEVVAMTGDGVNDAPSLKAADIGVAMGGRGADVAREAASIVLLDDDFGSIVTTIRLGRRIYDNLRKAMSFILAVHVPIAGLALLPLLFGLPLFFAPVHIAFLQMVIDPVCALVFEAETEEDSVMRQPPRDPADSLFSLSMVVWSVVQGLLAFGLVAAIYIVALYREMPIDEARALTFFSLVISIIALIFVNRSASASLIAAFRRPNRALAFVLPIVCLALALTLLWPAAGRLFKFGPLHADDLLISFGAGALILVVLELLKPLWRTGSARRAIGRSADPSVQKPNF